MATIKKAESVDLYIILKDLTNKQIPIKFNVATNLALVEPIFQSYQKEREKIFKEHVKLNQNGDPVMTAATIEELKWKEGDEVPANLPFRAYEYDKPQKDMIRALEALAETTDEVAFHQEDMERKINIKSSENGKEVYKDATIRSLIEDPNSPILAAHIGILTKFCFKPQVAA